MWIMKAGEPNELINLSFALRIYSVEGPPSYNGTSYAKIIADFGHDRLMVILVADNKDEAASIIADLYKKLNNQDTEAHSAPTKVAVAKPVGKPRRPMKSQ